jgi:hypothetical protein
MNKWVLIVGSVVIVLGGIIFAQFKQTTTPPAITNFEECAAAGNPVMESYPRRCNANGQTFTQDIGNELEYSDTIQVTNPRPNQVITNPLVITGQARGTWYFEANFPLELQDLNGIVLGTSFATAQGEWMTEEFVPFTAEITFAQPTTPSVNLVIKNANPSGLPENEKTLVIPVKIQ